MEMPLALSTKTRGAVLLVPLALIAPLLAGCEIPQAPEETAELAPPEPVYGDAEAPAAAAQAPGDAQPGAGDTPPAPGDVQPAPGGVRPAADDAQPAPSDDASADADDGGELVEAKAGVSGKGNYGPGFITTPISTYFTLRERVAFRHLQNELKTYVAARGKLKDFKEVEEKVIKPAAINLPELPTGDRYVYLPDKGPWGEVMVLKKDAVRP